MHRTELRHVEWARRVLALEGATGSNVDDSTTAASRVYDRLYRRLAPLVGEVGVELLFVRSAKLANGELAAALDDVDLFESAASLDERLRARDPALATESVAALFGAFFTLLTTLIGEQLTVQILRSAWPTIDLTASAETPE